MELGGNISYPLFYGDHIKIKKKLTCYVARGFTFSKKFTHFYYTHRFKFRSSSVM